MSPNEPNKGYYDYSYTLKCIRTPSNPQQVSGPSSKPQKKHRKRNIFGWIRKKKQFDKLGYIQKELASSEESEACTTLVDLPYEAPTRRKSIKNIFRTRRSLRKALRSEHSQNPEALEVLFARIDFEDGSKPTSEAESVYEKTGEIEDQGGNEGEGTDIPTTAESFVTGSPSLFGPPFSPSKGSDIGSADITFAESPVKRSEHDEDVTGSNTDLPCNQTHALGRRKSLFEKSMETLATWRIFGKQVDIKEVESPAKLTLTDKYFTGELKDTELQKDMDAVPFTLPMASKEQLYADFSLNRDFNPYYQANEDIFSDDEVIEFELSNRFKESAHVKYLF